MSQISRSNLFGRNFIAISALAGITFLSGCLGSNVQNGETYKKEEPAAINQNSNRGVMPSGSPSLTDNRYLGKVVDLDSSSFYDFVSKGNRVVLFWNSTLNSSWSTYGDRIKRFDSFANNFRSANFGKLEVMANGEAADRAGVELRPQENTFEVVYFRDGRVLGKQLEGLRAWNDPWEKYLNENCKKFYSEDKK